MDGVKREDIDLRDRSLEQGPKMRREKEVIIWLGENAGDGGLDVSAAVFRPLFQADEQGAQMPRGRDTDRVPASVVRVQAGLGE